MALTTEEQAALRLHLGYTNISSSALPQTPDGFWYEIEQIVSTYLSTGTETTSSTAVTAGAVSTITVADASEFALYGEAIVDVGPNAEIVMVQAITTGSTETLTAHFAKAHSSSGYPVATNSGLARLRMLLWDANLAWSALTGQGVGGTAGLKAVDKKDVEFFSSSSVLSARWAHYGAIVTAISQLVGVSPAPGWPPTRGRGSVRCEAY